MYILLLAYQIEKFRVKKDVFFNHNCFMKHKVSNQVHESTNTRLLTNLHVFIYIEISVKVKSNKKYNTV